jgi:hypothetical protein
MTYEEAEAKAKEFRLSDPTVGIDEKLIRILPVKRSVEEEACILRWTLTMGNKKALSVCDITETDFEILLYSPTADMFTPVEDTTT